MILWFLLELAVCVRVRSDDHYNRLARCRHSRFMAKYALMIMRLACVSAACTHYLPVCALLTLALPQRQVGNTSALEKAINVVVKTKSHQLGVLVLDYVNEEKDGSTRDEFRCVSGALSARFWHCGF